MWIIALMLLIFHFLNYLKFYNLYYKYTFYISITRLFS